MLLLKPISKESIIGKDFTDDDKYLSLEVEIEQSFNDISQEDVDWEFIIRQSEEILTSHSKDFKVLSYWLYAQWNFNGFDAFLESFNTFALFLLEYNKNLYPLKEKRKVKILEWINKVFEKPFTESIGQLTKEQLRLLVETFNVMDQAITLSIEEEIKFLKPAKQASKIQLDSIISRENLQEEEQRLFKLEQEKRYEEDKKIQLEREQKQEQNKEVILKFKKQASVIESTSDDTNDEAILTREDIEECTAPLLDTSKTLLEKSPREYLPLGMLFFYGTIHLDEIFKDPEIETDELLPSDEIVYAIRDSLDYDIQLAHLTALEELIQKRPSWLEGYFFAARMLHRLKATENAKKIEEDIYRYIDRQSRCMEFVTSSGQKLIPSHLETWVKQKILSLRGEGDSNIKYQKVFHEATVLMENENKENALEFLEKHYSDARSEEEKFKWRLLLAKFIIEIGDKRLALALLFDLEKKISRFKLDLWQPNLAIETYEFLLHPMMTQEMGKDNQDRIYKKLCILDIGKVIDS